MRALAATIALVTLGWALPVAAQRAPAATSPRPGWRPRSVTIGTLTAAQHARAVARLEQIERILLQVPELANPQGFEIEPVFYGGARRLGQGQVERKDYVVEYLLTLMFFLPGEHEGGGCIQIRVNPDSDLFGGWRDETGREFGEEPRRGDPLPLATRVITQESSSYVDLAPGRAAPWRQATREEFYNAVIFEYEGKGGSKLAANRAAFGKTPYQEWLEGVDERKTQREGTLKALAAALPPAQVAEMRQTLENTEREVTERLKESDPVDQERYREAVTQAGAHTAAIRAELEAMSVEERRMPALVEGDLLQGGRTATGMRVVDRESPFARRIMTPDYDYWRARRSPEEARAIRVFMADWAALYQLLDDPR